MLLHDHHGTPDFHHEEHTARTCEFTYNYIYIHMHTQNIIPHLGLFTPFRDNQIIE